MDANELALLLKDMNEKFTPDQFKQLMVQIDKDKSGFIGLLLFLFRD